MQRTTHPVINIINDHAATADLNNHTIKKLSRLKACYEQSLGHHVLACQDCGKQHLIPNTCKGLHCPFCSYVKTQKWIASVGVRRARVELKRSKTVVWPHQ